MRGDRDTLRDRDKSPKLFRLGVTEVLPKNPGAPGSAREWARWLFVQAVAKHAPDVLVDLRGRSNEGLEAWAIRWHLPAWVLPHARATRRFWAEKPAALSTYFIHSTMYDGKGVQVQDDDLEPPKYDPQLATRASYQSQIDAYIARCEAAALRHGEPRPLKDPRALRWLVAHVVAPETSYADLWRGDHTVKSRNAIREACIGFASLIELSLPNKPAQK